jgi:hypothetical protein
MLFFYLPVIILEAWMLSPPKRRTNEPDALARRRQTARDVSMAT